MVCAWILFFFSTASKTATGPYLLGMAGEGGGVLLLWYKADDTRTGYHIFVFQNLITSCFVCFTFYFVCFVFLCCFMYCFSSCIQLLLFCLCKFTDHCHSVLVNKYLIIFWRFMIKTFMLCRNAHMLIECDMDGACGMCWT